MNDELNQMLCEVQTRAQMPDGSVQINLVLHMLRAAAAMGPEHLNKFTHHVTAWSPLVSLEMQQARSEAA